MRNVILGATLLGAIFFSSCAGLLNGKNADLLKNTNWKLTRILNEAYADSSLIATNLRFISSTNIAGKAPCNNYGAGCTVGENGNIIFTKIISTKMACDNLALETAFFNQLGKVNRFNVSGSHLKLYDGSAVVLEFVKIAD